MRSQSVLNSRNSIVSRHAVIARQEVVRQEFPPAMTSTMGASQTTSNSTSGHCTSRVR